MWPFTRRKRKAAKSIDGGAEKVLLLIDWDNLFLGLLKRFKETARIEWRIKRMLAWIREAGPIFEGCGFVFAPEHLNFFHQQMCVSNNLRLFICPKRKLEIPQPNPKTGIMEIEQDTVDETLMWFGKAMMRHPDVGSICLVSGDDDYVPFMEEAGRMGIRRMLAPPALDTLSRSKNLIRLVDRYPKTKRRMILRLDEL